MSSNNLFENKVTYKLFPYKSYCSGIERQNPQTADSDEPTGFVIQRDEWHAIYAGRTAKVYMNLATLLSWIKK